MNRYGAPTTYKRIRPDFGSGFILKRIYELTEAPGRERFAWPRKKDVYLGTPWYNRPGFASLLWSSLIKDGLIKSNGGMQKYTYCSFYKNPRIGTRAAGRYAYGIRYTVRYHLTPKGRGVLFDMMDRYNKICKEKKAFCERNGIQFGTGKMVAGPRPGEWREDDFLEPGETKEERMARNGVTPPPTPIERDILEKEAEPRDILENMTRTDLIHEYSNAAMEADRLAAQLLAHKNDVDYGFAYDRTNAAYNNICARRDALAKEIERREKNNEEDVPLLAMLANVSENQKLRDTKKDAISTPPNPIERDILEKEALDCAKLAADYAGENQKLRAEKNDLNERLKKLVLRLEWLEHEVSDVKNVLNKIIE